MFKGTIGLDRIVEARKRGYKPASMVVVDVGLTLAYQAFLRSEVTMPDRITACMATVDLMDDVPLATPYVLIDPAQSVRLMDWSWCVGLSINIDGDDEARVMAAHEKAVAAGARLVFSSADGRVVGEHYPQGVPA